MSNRFLGALDATPTRVVVKSELDVVDGAVTTAAAAAATADAKAVTATADAAAALAAIPAANDTLTSTATDEYATANAVKQVNDKIEGLGDGQVVPTLAARDALTGLDAGDMITVEDRGDGKWADYKVVSTTDGTAANSVFAPRLDEDALAGASSATNLSNTPSATTVAVESSTGANTNLPAATVSAAGILTAAQYTDLQSRNKLIPLPGNGVLVTFTIDHGYTDDGVTFDLVEVATGERGLGVNMTRAPNSSDVVVGPFAVAPPNATTYALSVVRG